MRCSFFTAACALWTCAITDIAGAEFTHAHIENLGDVGGGANTYRVYVNFDHPLDQMLGIGAVPGVAPLSFSSTAPLINDGGPLAGLPEEDLPQYPISAIWDSWLTIDADTARESEDVQLSFPEIEYDEAVIVGTEWSFEKAGVIPGGFDPRHPVLIAQFTSPGDFTFSGLVIWTPAGGSPGFVTSYFEVTTACPADLNGTGAVDLGDLLIVLSSWGECPPGAPCEADIDGDGEVGFPDLLFVLDAWGPCF